MRLILNYAEPAKKLWHETCVQIHNADFTTAEPPKIESAKFSLIVCNPPYVRHHHLSQTQKRDLQSAVARHLKFEMNGLSAIRLALCAIRDIRDPEFFLLWLVAPMLRCDP
jgi:methylase of polypeptide subunit release factors